MRNSIVISDLIGTKLQSRIEVKRIKDSILSIEENYINLDFEGVTFMSRSFADELCGIINSFSNKNIKLINEDSSIEGALNIISYNRNKPKNIKVDYTTLKFSNIRNLSEYLTTI